MSRETRRGGRDSGEAMRPSTAGTSVPRSSGRPGCVLIATNRDAPAETESMATAAQALARWENEGGRVLAGQRPSEMKP